MFDLLDEQDNEAGSEERYHQRISVYERRKQPVRRHMFWWFVHNVIAHPLIGCFPLKVFFDFHDWTSGKINLRNE